MFGLYTLVKLLNDPENVVSVTAHLGILTAGGKELGFPGLPQQTQREKLRCKFPVVQTLRNYPIYFICYENKIRKMKFIELSIPQLLLGQGGVYE